MDDLSDVDDIPETPIASEEDEKDEDLYLTAYATVYIREELNGEPIEFHLPKDMVRPPKPLKAPASEWRPLLVGFDTEYQSLKELFTQDDVKAKKAKYEVLSYQFYSWMKDSVTEGIVIPEPHQRINFTDFIVYVAAKIAAKGELRRDRRICSCGQASGA